MTDTYLRLAGAVVLLGLLVAPAGCKKSKTQEVRAVTPVVGLVGPVNVLAPGTADDEQFDATHSSFAVGADGIARLTLLRIVDSNLNGAFENGIDASQILYLRRRADGTWTVPIALSALDTDPKSNPQLAVVPVGANAGTAFVFWCEGSGTPAGELRMARVSAGDPPAVLTGGATGVVISDNVAPAPLNLRVPPPLLGAVEGFDTTAAVDTVDGSVYAAWTQRFDDGVGGIPSDCIVVGRYAAGGTGLAVGEINDPDEKISLTEDISTGSGQVIAPGNGMPLQLVFAPAPAVAGGGTMHAVYGYNAANVPQMGIFSRSRTAAGTWTPAAPGDLLSDVPAGGPIYNHPVAAVDGAGNLYVAWGQAIPPAASVDTVRHAFRPAGAGPFAADVTASPPLIVPTSVNYLALALDGTTPVIAAVRQDSAGGDVSAEGVVGTAGASGPFGAATILHAPTTTEGGEFRSRVRIVPEAGGRMAIVYDVPAAVGGPLEVFGVVRPSGGAFLPEVLLSRALVDPPVHADLVGSAAAGGTGGTFVMVRGPGAGPREIVAVDYASGGFSAPINVSATALIDSHGEPDLRFFRDFVGVVGTAGGQRHVWWAERLGAAQDDIYYVQR